VDQKGKLRIPRVDIAFDAGKIMNPDRVRAQFEGASVFGTSLALMGEISAMDGKIQPVQFPQLSGGAHRGGAVQDACSLGRER